ncbi:MAG: pyridoxine 5'-phosphate oxidase C-terminal domain-containing protein, partial [Pseudomonadota bacterium]|nr:pyridoxine 5'-phosphate oxidase C-terminal domain-containing protein [Pseudomonadota bacterium]
QIEFWQGGEDRLHDRFEYNKTEDGAWVTQRLMP